MTTPQTQRAAALVTVLIFLVLLTGLAVAMMVAMRSARQQSDRFAEKGAAERYAGIAFSEVLGRMQHAIGGDDSVWLSAPGVLRTRDSNGSFSTETLLHSGVDPAAPSVNFNRESFTDPNRHWLDPAGGNFPVNWIWIMEDGTTTASPSPSDNVTGRFAFWVDDESTKINLNLALGRFEQDGVTPRAGLSPSDTTLVNPAVVMDDVSTELADAWHDAAKQRPFNILSEAELLPGGGDAIRTNSHQLTQYNHSPVRENNPFGEPKIVLTTQRERAGGRPFLDILKVDNTDPGKVADIDRDKYFAVANTISGFFSRDDWPMAPGEKLETSYLPNRVLQTSYNIIDYVRSKESAHLVVEPVSPTNPIGNNSFKGLTRAPLITEQAIWSADTTELVAGQPRYKHKALVEVHLPDNYGIDELDLTDGTWFIWTYETTRTGSVDANGIDLKPYGKITGGTSGIYCLPNSVLRAGEYVVIVFDFYRTARITSARLRADVTQGSEDPARPGYMLDEVVRLNLTPFPSGDNLSYNLQSGIPDNDAAIFSQITSRGVDDPRIAGVAANYGPQQANTFGAPNTNVSTLGETPGSITGLRPQDTENGRLTDMSMFMPPPAGSPGNLSGRMESLGELGFVCTGYESQSGDERRGVPWRSLRLQPNPNTGVPDWALLEIFSLPDDPSPPIPTSWDFVSQPWGSRGGLVNLNVGAGSWPGPINRSDTIAAVLFGARSHTQTATQRLGLPEARTLAENIVNVNWKSPSTTYGEADWLDSVGEVVEIEGLAENESREELVRQVLGLVSSSSSVFSVYVVAESLKGTGSQPIVTSTVRRRYLLERRAPVGEPVQFSVIQVSNPIP